MIRIIGDVHGKFDQYKDIVMNSPHPTFQLGDFGFVDTWLELEKDNDIDKEIHKQGQGNHDCHDLLKSSGSTFSGFVGRYGNVQIKNESPFFWVGGALSIDMVYRVGEWLSYKRAPRFKTWFANEQLSYDEMQLCLTKYVSAKPERLVCHTCPASIIKQMPSAKKSESLMENFGWEADYHDITSQFLDSLIRIHKPKHVVFGHFHRNFDKVIDDVRYTCVGELQAIDI